MLVKRVFRCLYINSEVSSEIIPPFYQNIAPWGWGPNPPNTSSGVGPKLKKNTSSGVGPKPKKKYFNVVVFAHVQPVLVLQDGSKDWAYFVYVLRCACTFSRGHSTGVYFLLRIFG